MKIEILRVEIFFVYGILVTKKCVLGYFSALFQYLTLSCHGFLRDYTSFASKN